MRALLIYLSQASWAKKAVTSWNFAWKMASRFVAGDTLKDAVEVSRELNEDGINTTLDHLGEHISNIDESIKAANDIIDALKSLSEFKVKSNVSIKLSQIGFNISVSECKGNLRRILTAAKSMDNFIRVDMEDSTMTQGTIDLVIQMKKEGFANVGTVIQSYLFRSESDVKLLAHERISIRLCKGAYNEPHSIAHPYKKDVDRAYDRLAEDYLLLSKVDQLPLISAEGKTPPLLALATHDENRIETALQLVERIGIDKRSIEFQMLYGIRRDLQTSLRKAGFPVRVYVPYGTQWYPYFMRRLAERPANIWFFISNLFRR